MKKEDKKEDKKEEIDKQTLSIIQKKYNIDESGREINLPEIQPQQTSTNHFFKKETEIQSNETNLEEIVQNAKNTILFYEYISKLMNNKNLKISNELLENSKKIFDILEKIYIHYHTKNFVSKTNLINNKIDYENAIKLALFEEIIALRTYQEFKEYNQYSYKKQFEDIIIFKICNINLLNLASLN